MRELVGLHEQRDIDQLVDKILLCSQGWRMTQSRMVINGDGDRLLASRAQSWNFDYLVQATAPDVLI